MKTARLACCMPRQSPNPEAIESTRQGKFKVLHAAVIDRSWDRVYWLAVYWYSYLMCYQRWSYKGNTVSSCCLIAGPTRKDDSVVQNH